MTISIPGLRLIAEAQVINIDALDSTRTVNVARSTGEDPLHVKQLKQSFEAQGWREDLGYPIAVIPFKNGVPVLIDGHHRLDAWSQLGHTTIKCDVYTLTGICSLEDIAVQVGLKANDHPPAKGNSKRDIERAIQRLVNEMDDKPSRDEIYDLVISYGLNNLTDKQIGEIAEKVHQQAVCDKQIVTVNQKIVEREIQNKYDQYGDIDHVYSCTPSKAKVDYSHRHLIKALEHYVNTGEQARAVIFATQVFNARQVHEAREVGLEKMKREFDLMRSAVKTLKDNEYPWEVVAAYPQIRGIEESEQPVFNWDD